MRALRALRDCEGSVGEAVARNKDPTLLVVRRWCGARTLRLSLSYQQSNTDKGH
jgi:hypothetical protein